MSQKMTNYQIAGAVLGAALLWNSRSILRSIVRGLFPQALPGEKNTALLASAKPHLGNTPTAKDLEDIVEYDYIIVGTGTAGSVLAARLSEDASVNILSIESGYSDLKQLMSRIPAGVSRLFKTTADWAFTTTPQPHCHGREMDWPRGKMIGGSSSANAMMYTRGTGDDYDEWASLGNEGWSFKDLSKYMRRAEGFRQTDDPDRRLPEQDLAQHGRSGPWQVGYTWAAEIGRPFRDGCATVGIPKVADINTDKGILGAAPTQTFIDAQGQRSSTAVAYLTADVVKRPNLKISSGQSVTRIIFDTSGSEPRAVGVEMASPSSYGHTRFYARARKEVIVCCGSIGTPQLLKLSGIGPANELNTFDIPLVKDLPGVGENLIDHLAYSGVVFKTDKKASIHYLLDPIASLPAVFEWFRSGSGPMTGQACDNMAYVRATDRVDAPEVVKQNDRTSGPGSADLELISLNLCLIDNGQTIAPLTDGYASIISVCLRPEARGSVKLASKDPFAAPLIDPNALSNDYDLAVLSYGAKLAARIAKSEPYKKYFKGWYISERTPIDWDNAKDAQIEDDIRKACHTLYHPMGTAKMGNGADCVVDSNLKVHGVQALRVVDASIFPTPLACHTCAPVVMTAEKAADLIKNQQ